MNTLLLALMLLQIALEDAKVNGAAPEIVEGIEAAIAAIQKVHGSDVTFAQLEQLRSKALW